MSSCARLDTLKRMWVLMAGAFGLRYTVGCRLGTQAGCSAREMTFIAQIRCVCLLGRLDCANDRVDLAPGTKTCVCWLVAPVPSWKHVSEERIRGQDTHTGPEGYDRTRCLDGSFAGMTTAAGTSPCVCSVHARARAAAQPRLQGGRTHLAQAVHRSGPTQLGAGCPRSQCTARAQGRHVVAALPGLLPLTVSRTPVCL